MAHFNGHVRQLAAIPERLLAPLSERVASIGELWAVANETKPNNFDCFSSTRHIVFQFPDDLNSHQHSTYTNYWPDWRTLIEPIILAATRCYEYADGQTARIMLANVAPGGRIDRHVDEMASADLPHKIHVPIQTHPKARFFEGNAVYHLRRGFAYEVNNKIPHGVDNGSEAERVHLIFDFYDGSPHPAGAPPAA